MTTIEWTNETWNPTSGCFKVSPGCKHCYAEAFTARFPRSFPNGFKLTLHPERLTKPLRWKAPRRIFVNSMSDLFHEDVPDKFVAEVFAIMHQAHWHQFQTLTKRVERLCRLPETLCWPANSWFGVSVENEDYIGRIEELRRSPAAVKFLSLEPLIGPLRELNLAGIDWVIVGGESQSGCRPMNPEWAREIRDQCARAGVAFFMKQLGGHPDKRSNLEDLPADLRIRNYPR
jgi:protein gp37